MNRHSRDINHLLRCHHSDDPAIIEEMIERYYALVYREALAILHDPDEAQDAVQDTFIRAMNKLDQYKIGTNFQAWLYTIAANVCRGYLRKRKRRETLGKALKALQSLVSRPPGPELATLQSETRSQLWAAVDQLGEKHRTTVVLRMVYGLSIQEISQMTGVKEKTVYTRLYDAFGKLRQQLEGKVELEEVNYWQSAPRYVRNRIASDAPSEGYAR
jgi:RNA polymerase sigma-70 factor (ECF subfamily)